MMRKSYENGIYRESLILMNTLEKNIYFGNVDVFWIDYGTVPRRKEKVVNEIMDVCAKVTIFKKFCQ